MRFVQFTLKHSLLFNLLTALVVAVGLIKTFQMRREAFPAVDFDVVFIQTPYPGASPQEVEQYVTDPIEDEVGRVDGIEELNSFSVEAFSLIFVRLDPDLSESDKDKAVTEIQRAVDRVRDLPRDLPEQPLVKEMKSGDQPIIEVALSGEVPYARLHELSDRLADRIEELEDVQEVQKLGYREKEFWLEVDPKKLEHYNISLGFIIGTLATRNVSLPGGALKSPEGEWLVRTLGEVHRAAEIENILLRVNDAGIGIRVKDVARVRDTFEEITRANRTNGHESINLWVLKAKDGDIIRMVDQVKEVADDFAKTAGEPKLKIDYINDISIFVRNRLQVLISNALFGLVLVLICLLISMSKSIALVTAWGIPVAVLGTMMIMGYTGLTVNLITMVGLVIVVGMLVDDGIIVAENIWTHYERGESARDAVVNGTSEVIWPVTSTVLTTIAAFLPLMMVSGIFGKFLSSMPKVVMITLCVSMIEAFVALPSHSYNILRVRDWWYRRKNASPALGPAPVKHSRVFDTLTEAYGSVLAACLRLRYLLVSALVVLLLFSLWFAREKMKFILFPAEGIEIFFVRADLPLGTSLEETSEKFRTLEAVVQSLPPEELSSFVTHIGIQQNDPNDPFTHRGSYLGQMVAFLTPEKDRTRTADEIVEALRPSAEATAKQEGFTRLVFERAHTGPPVGKPVAVRLKGDDLGMLDRVADDVMVLLAKTPGVRDADKSYKPGKKELQVIVDEEAAARSLLTVQQIALHVQAALGGAVATTIREGGDRIDLRVRYKEEERKRIASLSKLSIPNAMGQLVPLATVARLQRTTGINSISHRDEKRTITVSAGIDEKATTSELVNKQIAPLLKEMEVRNPGLIVEAGGEWEDTAKSLESLREAFLVALALIFIILATQFKSLTQPFVVMSTIPFGVIGVIWAFYAHDLPLSFMGLIGTIGLAGVVVNDAIVLVSFLNDLRAEGMNPFDAAVAAGKRRWRAVWLTTITTVAGLLPLVYGIGGSDKFLRPSVLALGYGLLFATILTLFFIPCVYLIRLDVGNLLLRVLGRSRS
ncbi:MAG: efflux RND transporter permease subunit [Nitrospirae bacterium]|nr:efflux RND transporter permease subunit [Nitrospirota bacterium]